MSECHCPCRGIATNWHNYVLFVDGMLTCWMLGAQFSSKLHYAVCMISIKLNQCVPGYIPPSFPHKINHVPIRTSCNSKCRWLLHLPLVPCATDRWVAEACSRSWTTWSVTSGPTSNGCCKSLRPWGCAVAAWCCLMLLDAVWCCLIGGFHMLWTSSID